MCGRWWGWIVWWVALVWVWGVYLGWRWRGIVAEEQRDTLIAVLEYTILQLRYPHLVYRDLRLP